MITVKQVLVNYDILTEKADNDSKNLVALVHAGLLDESKLPILKRAMSKPAINMTEAEKKALHNLVESISSSIISEKQDYLSKLDTSRRMGYPPDKDIPAVIILKRKAIRVYPDNQKVALYYSQALDRYISIPYGKNSKALDMTLNEEQLQLNDSRSLEESMIPLDEISRDLATRAYEKRRKRLDDEDLTPEERKKERVKLAQLSKMMKRNIELPDGQKIRTWAGPSAVKRAKFISASPDEKKKMAMGLSAKERADTPGATKAAVYGALQHGGAEGIGAAAGVLIGGGVRKLAGVVMDKIRGHSNEVDPAAKTIEPGKIKAELKAELQKTQEVKPTEVPIVKPPEMPPIANRMTGSKGPPMMKESFRKHLEEKRLQKEDIKSFTYDDLDDQDLSTAKGWKSLGKDFIPGVALARSAERTKNAYKQGDVAGTAWHGAMTALDATAAGTLGKLAVKGIYHGGKTALNLASKGFTKKAGTEAAEAASKKVAAETAEAAAKGTVKKPSTAMKWLRRTGKIGAAAAGIGAAALGALGSVETTPTDKNYDFTGPGKAQPPASKAIAPGLNAAEINAGQQNARLWNTVKESNNLDIMKQMVEHNISSHIIHINETSITINNRVAKKVVNVYESLNRQNKKKIEKMLNEDALSFKKAINFAIKA